MYIFTTILFLILLLVALLSIFPIKVAITANSESLPNFHISFSWLNPFITGAVTPRGQGLMITIKLFNMKIIKKDLAMKLNNNKNINKLDLIRNLKLNNIELKTSYGFKDMSITGMTCAAINIISQYIHLNSINNNPDFTAEYDYFEIDGILYVNALSIISSFIKATRHEEIEPIFHPAK